MAVEYVVVKNRFQKGTGVGGKYIKGVANYIVDDTEIARRISSQCSVTEADVRAVLQAYETNLKMMFSHGNSVRIFNLGTLKPCFKADFDKNGKVIKESLRMSKVQLIANRSFLNDAKGYEYRNRGETEDYCPDFEGRVKNMIDYFESGFEEITVRDYIYINDCSKSQACEDLNLLYGQEMLSRRSYGNTRVYWLNANNELKDKDVEEKSVSTEPETQILSAEPIVVKVESEESESPQEATVENGNTGSEINSGESENIKKNTQNYLSESVEEETINNGTGNIGDKINFKSEQNNADGLNSGGYIGEGGLPDNGNSS